MRERVGDAARRALWEHLGTSGAAFGGESFVGGSELQGRGVVFAERLGQHLHEKLGKVSDPLRERVSNEVRERVIETLRGAVTGAGGPTAGIDFERIGDAVRDRLGDALRERIREAIRERIGDSLRSAMAQSMGGFGGRLRPPSDSRRRCATG